MKRSFIIICALLAAAVGASAQTSAAAKKRVAEIREMYAVAQADIARADTMKMEDRLPRNDMVVTSDYMVAGAGPCTEVTHYYFTGDYDENLDRDYFVPYFIMHKHEVASNTFYQEFLYDENGDLVFYYEKDISENNETRFYFGSQEQGANDEGLVHEIIKNSRTIEPPFAVRYSYELLNAFNNLMNREF